LPSDHAFDVMRTQSEDVDASSVHMVPVHDAVKLATTELRATARRGAPQR
jgi:hypothetical protein